MRKENILVAFAHYRPDLKYIDSMAFVAGTFLIFCSEFDSFRCFVCLIHDHYFMHFFEGAIQNFTLRKRLFDQYFEKHLPELYDHFQGLEILTEYFLTDWLLSLFTKCLSFDVATRVWDNFLLQGEVFAFKTGIAFLAYFES